MTRQQMALFDQLFEQASAMSKKEWEPWLALHCTDAEVRAELESLLPHASSTGGFTGVLDAAAVIGRPSPLPSGMMIGPYRIVGVIGEGGMGAVYEGVRDDDQFRHRVAIKVLRIGARSEPLRRRFLQERQILAELEHPNIARLFDGGTAADGSPYLVMERIDGEPLIAFAESHQLTIRQRLELFRKIAGAVQCAHQKLIVHRDLKPGNILVTVGADRRFQPKLLDFGIAKLLDDDGAASQALTATGFRLMTPDYASPEQVRGKPVTAASDIYSLGAVLYELLSGTRPHGLRSYDPTEIAERICVREVPPPSATGGPELRGDLDTIVLKAMHKDPERRYNSAEQFSEDLRRYLDGLPVLARPDTTVYRLRKFAARHWVGLGATGAVIIALTAGVAISVYQARRAQAQARIAQERFELVRSLANHFLFDFYNDIATVSGTTKAQQTVVNTAVEYLDLLSRTAGADQALLQDMAEAYGRLADVQGGQNVSHAGRYEDALISQRRSVEFYRKLGSNSPSNRSLAMAVLGLASIEQKLHRTESSVEHSREAVRILDASSGACVADTKVMSDCARAYMNVARSLFEGEKPAEALAPNLKGQEYLNRAVDLKSFSGKWRSAIVQQDEAKIRLELGDVAGASALLERVLRAIDELTVEYPKNRETQRLLEQHLGVLADCEFSLFAISAENAQKAVALHERRREVSRRLLESDPADGLARIDMAVAESESASPWIDIDPRRAVQFARSAIVRWDEILAAHRTDEFAKPRRARAQMRLALGLVRSGLANEALQPSQEAVEVFSRLHAMSPDESYYSRNMLFALTISGQALAGAKHDSEAQQAFQQAVELGEQMLARPQATLSHTLAVTYAFDRYGDYWKNRGKAGEARQWYERSRAAWAARPEQTPAVQQRRQHAQEELNGLRS